MKKSIKVLVVSCLCMSYLGIMTANATAVKSPNAVTVVAAPKSDYANIAVSQVTGYVNVREQPTTGSNIMGKVYNNCAATIEETVEGEGGTWYRIKSGTVVGFIKAQYFITGDEAAEVAQRIGKEFATIDAANLRLREKPDLTSDTLTLLSRDARYVVMGEEGDFYKVAIDVDMEGYIAKEFCKTTLEFEQAISLAEERALIEEETTRKREAAAAMEALAEVKRVESLKTGDTTTTKRPTEQTIAANPEKSDNSQRVSAPTTAAASNPNSGNSGQIAQGGSAAVVSATRNAIVAYSKQFLGNPYVYGGTSLTNGADCSGFTQGIYKNFGITTGRTSRDQAAKGRQIPIDSVQPGDLLFYASGDYINHVSLYIGGGQVIHASNATTGIIISPYNYRTPCRAVTFLD